MKNLRPAIIIGSILALFLSACDIVEAPYIEKPQNGNDTTTVHRNIVLEEFTGHRCPNCPTAGKVAHDLHDFYGDRVILLTVHASFLAEPFPGTYSYDFTTPAGDDYASTFNVTAVPTGMVSRRQSNGSYLLGKDKWGSEIAQVITLPADASINISTEYNSSNRNLDIDVETTFLNQLSGDYNLVVILVEDGIIKPQMNNDPQIGTTPDILNFEHNNILRTAVNGSFGESILLTSDSKSYSITLDAAWDETKMAVIAFISRADNADGTLYEIIQAEKAKI